MKWYIYSAILAGFIFVGTLMIEGLAILQLCRAGSTERKMWLTVQDRLKFLAAPSGSIIMALLVYALLKFSSWSSGHVLAMYYAVVAFFIVIILSSVWTPRRFKQVDANLSGKTTPEQQALDAPLAALWVVRMVILVSIVTTVVALQ